jgi:hypothetical protein
MKVDGGGGGGGGDSQPQQSNMAIMTQTFSDEELGNPSFASQARKPPAKSAGLPPVNLRIPQPQPPQINATVNSRIHNSSPINLFLATPPVCN